MKKSGALSVLKKKISNQTAIVGIIGIGVVGRSLSKIVASSGFKTIGFDIDERKVTTVSKQKHKNLTATSNFSYLSNCDVICICVPTPLTRKNKPDFSFIKKSTETIFGNLRDGQLIILESSICVGATRGLVYKKLKSSAKKDNKKFFLAYSPERIDPGNKKYNIVNTPKIVSGIDKESLILAKVFYKTFTKKVIIASSLETAELAKLFENTFRLINISFVHEIASYAKSLDLDIWEIIRLAKTKPFGFLAHYPGPGVGGHCIPVDPYYLLNTQNSKRSNLSLVKQALFINKVRPHEIVRYANHLIPKTGKKRIVLFIGISYKPDVSDIRQSKALVIWEILEKNGWKVSYHDPLVESYNGKKSVKLSKNYINSTNLVIITTNHSSINYSVFAKSKTLIIDTRNALKNINNSNIIRI